MKNILFTLCLATFFGCTTLKPDSSGVSAPDFDKRVEIEGPRYHRSINPIGIGSIVAGTVGGAYAGYQSQAIKYNDGTAQKTFDVGNALVGAAVGYSLTYLGNRLFGWGKTQRVTDNQEYRHWLSKANSDYRLLNSNSSGSIRAIHRSAESDFTVKTLADAQDFRQAFGNSTYATGLIDRIIDNRNLSRSDFSELARTFAGASNVIKLKREYINRSANLTQLLEAANRFPDTGLPVEKMAVDVVATCRDADLFRTKFPQSRYAKQLIVNALQGCSNNEIVTLSQQFSQDFQMSPSAFNQLNLNDTKKSGYFNAQFIVDPPKQIKDVFEIVQRYKWIDYPSRPISILNQFWNTGYATIENGDELGYFIRQLGSSDAYRQYKISQSDVDQVLHDKLDIEAKKYVSVISSNMLTPDRTEWENWKTSSYTAGIVRTKGLRKFLLYGEIENNSRFTLPIKLTNSGTLLVTAKVEFGVAEKFYDGVERIANAFGKTMGEKPPTTSTIEAGTRQEVFIIPNLRPKEKTVYATLLNFGETPNQGYNFGDVARAYTDIKLANVTQKFDYESKPLSINQRIKQQEWQLFAKNGLPASTVHDYIRSGKEVKESEWHEKYLQILRDRERHEKERQKSAQASSSLSESDQYEFEKFKKEIDKITKFKERANPPSASITSKNCPCDFYEIDFTWPKDNATIYKDSVAKWWVENLGTDSGPFNTYDELLLDIFRSK